MFTQVRSHLKFIRTIIFALVFLVGGFFIKSTTFAANGIVATGGTGILSNTGGISYTTLTGPSIHEDAVGDIKSGIITINAPIGFEFDSTNPAMITINGNTTNPTYNINNLPDGTTIATNTTSSQISYTVTAQSNSTRGTLTWSNIRIRPINTNPISDTNITLNSTSTITGLTLPMNIGAITVIDNTSPTLIVTGFTADGTDMSGSVVNGWTLNTNNVASKDYLIQFKSDTSSSEALKGEYFPLKLISIGGGANPITLHSYYSMRLAGNSSLSSFLTYLQTAVDVSGTQKPFAYINGSNLKLVDAAKHDLMSTDVDMTIPGNYPVGTYTVSGKIKDVAGNETTVTYVLIVQRGTQSDNGGNGGNPGGNPPNNSAILAILSSVHTQLENAGIINNLNTCTDPTACSNLSFEKTGKGKITFAGPLDLTNQATQTTLNGLGNGISFDNGQIRFDATVGDAFKTLGGQLEMYGLTYATTPNILADGVLATLSDVDNISYNGITHTLTFKAKHFTTFTTESNDPTPTTINENQTRPDDQGQANLSGETNQVVITNSTQPIIVNVGNGTDATVNLNSLITGGTGSIPQITINSSNPDLADVVIPAGNVTSADPSWNGVINAPTITTVSLPETQGQTKTLSNAIEVGFIGAKLNFSNAVKIIMPGEIGKKVGYVRNGIDFTEITTSCLSNTQTWANANLGTDGDCKIDVGADLVIWTKHFTKFATYTQITNSNHISSGGYIRPISSSMINVAATGKVLGAEKFNFTKFLKIKKSYNLNSQGNEVTELQKLLNETGFDSGKIDGKFGPITKAALIKFQIANSLKGDGIVGPLTRAILNK